MHSIRRIVLPVVLGLCLAPAAWGAAPDDDDDIEHDFTDDEDSDDDASDDPASGGRTEMDTATGDEVPPPPADGSDQPLAVPGPSTPPPDPRTRTTTAPGVRTTRVPRGPTSSAPPPRPDTDPLFLLDTGYRQVFIGQPYAPTGDGLGPYPSLVHATGAALLDKNILVGGSFEMPLNPLRGSLPFVMEARVGWWETAWGEPVRRGPLRLLPGTKVTYVGVRWVRDHFRGAGGEWGGRGDAGGLVLGYAYAAPLGRMTVVTDSQFSLYLLGWKGRNTLPVGLLNQRLSIGFDPVFIDVRFRSDPATGEELSVGLSFQSLFGLRRSEGPRRSRNDEQPRGVRGGWR